MNPIRTLSLALLATVALVATPLAVADPVNINTADAATLARELVGVGETRARAIVAHRSEHGPFRSIEELALVKGIGPRVIEQNRANLRVDPARPAARAPAAPARVPAAVRSPVPRPATGSSAGR